MRKLFILSTVAVFAGAAGAVAEDNKNLLQPVSYGPVTGDSEKDTVAYDMTRPSDLWVRFNGECFDRAASLEQASADAGVINAAR
jgi:hypothetical protein